MLEPIFEVAIHHRAHIPVIVMEKASYTVDIAVLPCSVCVLCEGGVVGEGELSHVYSTPTRM